MRTPERAREGGPEAELDRIIANLREASGTEALDSVNALDEAADENWLPQLKKLLAEDQDIVVREAAAIPIIRLEGLNALPQLLYANHLGEEEGHDNDTLAGLIVDLVERDPAPAAPLLREWICDPLDWRRSMAAWLWGFAARSVTAELLLTALDDPSPGVRAAAAGSLASFTGEEEVFAALVHACRDKDRAVRASAAGALGYYGDRRAMPALKKLRWDWSGQVRSIARHSIRLVEERGSTEMA